MNCACGQEEFHFLGLIDVGISALKQPP